MTATELHRRAMLLADIGDRLLSEKQHRRAARFYNLAVTRETKALKLCDGVEPSARILKESRDECLRLAWAAEDIARKMGI